MPDGSRCVGRASTACWPPGWSTTWPTRWVGWSSWPGLRARAAAWCCSIPIGRAALAARRGHELADDDFRAEDNLAGVLEPAGWTVVDLDDETDQYLAMAVRH